MNASQLKYPVLGVSRSGIVSVTGDYGSLRKCMSRGTSLRLGEFMGATLIDMDGGMYTINGFAVVDVAKPWWRRPLIFTTFYNADLEIRQEGTADVDVVKQMLRKAYRADRPLWDSAWGDFEEFDNVLNECRTFEDIAKLLP